MRLPDHRAPDQPPRRLRALLLRGAAGSALLLALSAAQPQTGAPQNAPNTGQNVTAQVQSEVAIALPSLAPLVDRVSPAVVTISAQLTTEAANENSPAGGDGGSDQPGSSFDEMLRRFFEERGAPRAGREVVALGSGFIVDPSGLIVTNNHVVGTSDKVTVLLQDNSRHQAKIIGRDEKTDLALIKIEASSPLAFVGWGDSDQAKVGDWVVAVGNPFGLGGSVTAGIISALGRNINEGPYDDFIQIDAPINRGNSGGPTFDLHGRVIGINTAIYSPSGGSVGIGFAIPANVARPIIAQLKEHGHVVRGWLGVAIQNITPPIAKSLGLDPNAPKGALVAAITPDSPAAKAGLKQGDVILSANGHPIGNVGDLPRLVAATPIGQKLDLSVRRGGKEVTAEATIAEMRDKQQAATSPLPDKDDAKTAALGVELSAIDPTGRARFHIPKDVEGVVVTRVAQDSPFAQLDLETGDVIVSVDQHPVKTPQEAADRMKQAAAGGNLLLLLNRHGTSQFVGLTVGPASGSSRPPR